MLQEALDFRAEADELHAFLASLDERAWSRPTTFQRWTPWDVVAHLHLYDQVSLSSLAGAEVFAAERSKLIGALASSPASSSGGSVAPATLAAIRWKRIVGPCLAWGACACG